MWIIRKRLDTVEFRELGNSVPKSTASSGWTIEVNPIAAVVVVVLCIAAIVGLYV